MSRYLNLIPLCLFDQSYGYCFSGERCGIYAFCLNIDLLMQVTLGQYCVCYPMVFSSLKLKAYNHLYRGNFSLWFFLYICERRNVKKNPVHVDVFNLQCLFFWFIFFFTRVNQRPRFRCFAWIFRYIMCAIK